MMSFVATEYAHDTQSHFITTGTGYLALHGCNEIC